jgi:hypothetical protein
VGLMWASSKVVSFFLSISMRIMGLILHNLMVNGTLELMF